MLTSLAASKKTGKMGWGWQVRKEEKWVMLEGQALATMLMAYEILVLLHWLANKQEESLEEEERRAHDGGGGGGR